MCVCVRIDVASRHTLVGCCLPTSVRGCILPCSTACYIVLPFCGGVVTSCSLWLYAVTLCHTLPCAMSCILLTDYHPCISFSHSLNNIFSRGSNYHIYIYIYISLECVCVCGFMYICIVTKRNTVRVRFFRVLRTPRLPLPNTHLRTSRTPEYTTRPGLPDLTKKPKNQNNQTTKKNKNK